MTTACIYLEATTVKEKCISKIFISLIQVSEITIQILFTLWLLIVTKWSFVSCLLFLLKFLFSKQSGPRSDCSKRSSLIRVHIVCMYAEISPLGAVWSGSTLFLCMRKLVFEVSIHMQQMASAHDIFRWFFVAGKGLIHSSQDNSFYLKLSEVRMKGS